MVELTGGDWFARSRVAFPGVEGLNPNRLTGKTVRIDGAEYKVIGVEIFCIKNVTGKPFSLVVQRGES